MKFAAQWRLRRCLIPFGAGLLGAGVVAALLLIARMPSGQPVTVARLAESGSSGRVAFEIHNQLPRPIKLWSAEVIQRVGTNWAALGDRVKLGSATCSNQPVRLEIQPPLAGRDWKVKVIYFPMVAAPKLFWWRLKQAWETRSLSSGWELGEGWEGERFAYTEVLPP